MEINGISDSSIDMEINRIFKILYCYGDDNNISDSSIKMEVIMIFQTLVLT